MRAVLFWLGVVTGLALGGGGIWLLLERPTSSGAMPAPIVSEDQGWARVAAAPDDARAWASLADRQASDGEVARAARSFATAVAIAPADAELRARYGFLLYELGRDGPALAQLRTARDLGSKAAMLDFTVTTLGSELDETGPFPRFVDKGDEPRVATAAGASPARSGRDAQVQPEAEPDDDGEDEERVEQVEKPQNERVERRDDGQEEQEVEEADDEPDEGDEAFEDEPDDDLEDGEPEPDAHPLEADAPRPPPVVAAQCTIPLRPRGRYGTFVADVVVGRREASLVFDTGATLTVITRDYAVAANVRIDDFNAITARTANGTTRFSTAVIDELAIGDLVATNIRAAVCDDCGVPGMAGLLGLDVQRQLRLSLDVTEGVARYPCE